MTAIGVQFAVELDAEDSWNCGPQMLHMSWHHVQDPTCLVARDTSRASLTTSATFRHDNKADHYLHYTLQTPITCIIAVHRAVIASSINL